MTIPSHLDLRTFARSSWIKDLPNHVCYAFLYDEPNHISENETFDGISLDSKYEGRAVRFGKKLYRFFSYVQNSETFNNVQYVVKMDDDVVLCPTQLFQFFNNSGINSKTYAGWFHNIDRPTVSYHKRADEAFVMLSRMLIARIISKEYCNDDNQEKCDSLGQRFDTNYGGTSLGIWLSDINDVDALLMNNVIEHNMTYVVDHLNPKDTFIYHPAKTVKRAQEVYRNCQTLSL